MSVVSFVVLVAVSLDVAAKCDKYVVGSVWIHNTVGDENDNFQGCRKGCFWNSTYTEDGVRKCEKCSDIQDEINCTNNDATCQWKKGKCKAQSCPNIAKTKNTGAYITDNTRSASSKGRARQLKECLEGSELEKKYNSQYWNDYRDHHNYQYYVNNIPDKCIPTSDCGITISGTQATNQAACQQKGYGCIYVMSTSLIYGSDPPTIDYSQDSCVTVVGRCQSLIIGASEDNRQSLCTANLNCSYIPAGDGYNPRCVPKYQTFSATGDAAANKQSCESLSGVYVPEGSYPPNPNNDDCQQQCYVRPNGATTAVLFVPGTHTKEQCEAQSCTYTGRDTLANYYSGNALGIKDSYPGDGINLVAGGVADLCNLDNKTGKNYVKCRMGENASLAINYVEGRCVDRLFTERYPETVTEYYCDLGAEYTDQFICQLSGRCSNGYSNDQQSCGNNQGTWTWGTWTVRTDSLGPTDCRTLFDTKKQKCEFDINERKNYVVFQSGFGGNRKPATYYEKCVQDETLRTDPYITLDEPDPVKNIVTTNITSANREVLFGYGTPESYCTHLVDLELEQCQKNYDADVQSCYDTGEDLALNYGLLVRNHVGTKAARAACHQVYGCMYSKRNERCSVWSVWAFVLTLVIVILVVGVGLGVFGVLVLPKLLGKSSA